MRRLLTSLVFCAAAVAWVTAGQRSPAAVPAGSSSARGAQGAMLTVDSIMRGPKLVGTAPSAVRWSRDSSKVYFTWQKPDETRPATYSANRDGSGLRELTADEARAIDV